MNKSELQRQHLLRRKAEILDQLGRVNAALMIELDRDPEEQAIQLEQDEVSVTMEGSLRAELDDIDEKLAAMKD